MTAPREVAAPKAHLDGTHRVVEPAETLARLLPHLRTLGVTRVGVVTGLDVIGIPVVMVCRPNGRCLSVAQGKGVDLVAAKVSGIMEALESWHAENILLPLRLATYRELRRVAPVVDVSLLPRMSWSRFHPDLTILWVQGTDLVSGEAMWVPYECVHLDFRLPGPQGSSCFAATGTGLAAGNHLLEAISHALCEVVEREALTLWGLRPERERAAGRLRLADVDDPWCVDLLARYDAAGVAVAVDDVTSDVGLPAFRVTIVDRDVDPSRRLPAALGSGCHTDRAVALSRALTEAAQSRLTLIAGSRDDATRASYHQLRDPRTIEGHLAHAMRPSERSFHDVAHVAGASLDDDVAREIDHLRSVGIERVIMVDLTRPELDVPVVRMVVPGVEGYADKAVGLVLGARARALLR